jgi:hypothetical protein
MSQQPLATQQYQPYQTLDDGAGKPDKRTRFPANEDSDCQDCGWAVAFVIHLVGFIGLIGWRAASDFASMKHPDQEIKSDLTTGYLPAALLAVGFGIMAAVIWTVCIRSCAYAMLMMVLVVDALLMLAFIGLSLMAKNIIGAAVMGFFFCLYLLWIYCIWDRIPFTAKLITTATEIMVQAPKTLCVTFHSLWVGVLFSIISLVGLACLKFEVDHHKRLQKGAVYGLLILLVFSSYWTSAVISNVLHMTICGVVGRWYFKAKDWANATSASMGRALGKSFGSVCFGSFIIAMLKTIRFMIDMARNSAEDSPAAIVILCVLDCIVSCIEDFVQFFNTYAYVYCSIYGMKFWDAGKRTWNLFESTGLDMIIAYDLSGSLTFLGALLGGLFSSLLTYASIHFMGDKFEMHGKGWLKPKDGDLTPAYTIFAFLSGFMFVLISSTPIESGVTALLVCYAEEPDVLAENYPGLHKELQDLGNECQRQRAEQKKS